MKPTRTIFLMLILMKAWHINDWDYRENADTRKYVDLIWFRNKVKLLGEGLGHTLSAPNGRGPHLYGMFKLIEQVAAGGKLHERGWLFRNGSPMDAARIASLLRLPVDYVEEALKFFSTPPMDWLKFEDYPVENLPSTGRAPGDSPGHLPSTGRAPGEMRHPTDRPTVVQRLTSGKEKETKKAASPEQAKQQGRQFAAAQSIVAQLEAIPDDDRTAEQERDLKKMRGRLKAIQKKQAAGDFAPVEEEGA